MDKNKITDIRTLLKTHSDEYYYIKERSGDLWCTFFSNNHISFSGGMVNEIIYSKNGYADLPAYKFDVTTCEWKKYDRLPGINNWIRFKDDNKFEWNRDTCTNCEALIKKLKTICSPDKVIDNDDKYWEWLGARIGKCENIIPTPPTTEEGQVDKSSCSNTGQFGGSGTPLKDIKLFLYANNVTKGTIKLSKPQVEVGTFATDWRPNPSDYVERNSPAYKEVKGVAIQHNKEQNKKYIEVQATDGTVYGVDIWGGDAKKLLEQQQAEIEELKKLIQTLETKINV